MLALSWALALGLVLLLPPWAPRPGAAPPRPCPALLAAGALLARVGAAAALLPGHRAPRARQRQAGQRPQLPPAAPAARLRRRRRRLPGRPARAGPGWCSAPGAGSAPARGVAPAAGAAASQRPVGAAALLRLPAGHAAAGVGEPGQRLLAARALGRAGGQLAPVLCPVRAQPAALHVEERRVPPLGALGPARRRRRGGPCCRRTAQPCPRCPKLSWALAPPASTGDPGRALGKRKCPAFNGLGHRRLLGKYPQPERRLRRKRSSINRCEDFAFDLSGIPEPRFQCTCGP